MDVITLISVLSGTLGITKEITKAYRAYEGYRKELERGYRRAEWREGHHLIRENRRDVNKLLCAYYSEAREEEYHGLWYSSRVEGAFPMPLVSRKELLSNDNLELNAKKFVNEKITAPLLTMDEIAQEVALWESLDINIWDDPLYSLRNVMTNGDIEFQLSSFLHYRATFGSLVDELATALARHSIDDIISQSDDIMPKRKRFLPDMQTLTNFSTRISAGGPAVLFAARINDDVALVLQRRSFKVSDEPGAYTVIPKAFHQPIVDVDYEIAIQKTIYREVFEELFGGEDEPAQKKHLDPEFYLYKSKAVAEIVGNNKDESKACLQTLGLVWDLVRGNYHPLYCLYIDDPTWWQTNFRDMRVNWEVEKNVDPVVRFSQTDMISHLVKQPNYWAPESYVAFVEGLRWLCKHLGNSNEHSSAINNMLPKLELAPLKELSEL